MIWCLRSNPSLHVWAEEGNTAFMKGYYVQYAPACEMVWCEKSNFERYYKQLI